MNTFTEKVFLLVEDSPDDVLLLKRAFATADVDNPLVCVSDGQDAIDYLDHVIQPNDRSPLPFPVAILTDLKMPRLDGFDLLRWLRAQPALQSVPVIVLTSSALQEDVERAYELGANFFLTKPSRFEEQVTMVTRLAEWLRLNRFPDNRRQPV